MRRQIVYVASGIGHVVLLAALGTIRPPEASAALQTVTLVELPPPAPEPPKPPKPVQEPPPPEPEPEPEPQQAPEAKRAPEPRSAPRPSKAKPAAAVPATAPAQVPAVPTAAGGGADAPVIDVPELDGGGASAGPAPARPAAEPRKPPASDGGDDGGCDEPLVKAEPIEVPEPSFTAEARAEGIAGRVRLSLQIDASGKVTSAKVTDGLGFGLDEAAVSAARRAAFKPATRCGRPVASSFKLAIQFSP